MRISTRAKVSFSASMVVVAGLLGLLHLSAVVSLDDLRAREKWHNEEHHRCLSYINFLSNEFRVSTRTNEDMESIEIEVDAAIQSANST